MIDPNELRDISHNIELEQEKLRQEKKAHEIEEERRKCEETTEGLNEGYVTNTSTLASLTSTVSTLNQIEGALINSAFFH